MGIIANKLLTTRWNPLANCILSRVMKSQSQNMKWKKNRLRESHYQEGPLGKTSLEIMELGYLVHDTSKMVSCHFISLFLDTRYGPQHARGGL